MCRTVMYRKGIHREVLYRKTIFVVGVGAGAGGSSAGAGAGAGAYVGAGAGAGAGAAAAAAAAAAACAAAACAAVVVAASAAATAACAVGGSAAATAVAVAAVAAAAAAVVAAAAAVGYVHVNMQGYGMQSSRSSVVCSRKVADTCSHTLPTPAWGALTRNKPRFVLEQYKKNSVSGLPQRYFFSFSRALCRMRQTATNECTSSCISSCKSMLDGARAPFNLKFAPKIGAVAI